MQEKKKSIPTPGEGERPPLFKNWRGWYLFVLAVLGVLILLFYLFTKHYE